MLIIGIILIIVSILLTIYNVRTMWHVHQLNQEVDNKNQELLQLNKELETNKTILDNNIKEKKEQLNDIQNNISKTIDNQKELSQKAFENYCEVLDNQYKEYEEEYKTYQENLETSYSNKQLELMRVLDETRAELDKIKATRTAAIQAQTREKEIEDKLSFYCLTIAENELRDIAVLESIKPKLVNPRILSMLIWQTYWQKPLNRLIADVVGTGVTSGIYKITNVKTKECYIGQAVNISDRFKQHCKAACGIDTPAGNKLYKAMQEYGIQNFSWEVLEPVPAIQLNEKEAYYINLYDSKNYGYNSVNGITNK